MRPDWRALLTEAGAVVDEGRVLRFADPLQELRTAMQGDIVCDLSQQGVIAAQGPDTQAFLQGQVTCDVREVTPEHSQLGAYCTPKGRMLAIFRLFQYGDNYYLCMPSERVAPILKRLRLFVLRAKTTLEDASDTLVQIGLAGPNAETLLQQILGAAPSKTDQVTQTEGITVIRVPGTRPRFELFGEVDDTKKVWTALAAKAIPVGADPWRLLDILAGVPSVSAETAETFVPQMANLQLLNGVSFQKGCYTGQEIVARTRYLGKLKRRMYLARVHSTTLPRPGEELFSPQADASQSAGRIVAACRHPEGGFAALAVVLIDCAEGAGVLLGDAHGAPLEFMPLPYSFETPAA